MRKLYGRVTYENPYTAMRTIELYPEAWEVVRDWLIHRGLEPKDVVRGYRVNVGGLVTFKCGVGYAVIDEDLLGGDGSGKHERKFQDDTDSFIYIK